MHRSRALEASLLLGTAGGMMWGPPEAWARHYFPGLRVLPLKSKEGSKDQVSMKGLSISASQGSCRPPALEPLSHQLRRDPRIWPTSLHSTHLGSHQGSRRTETVRTGRYGGTPHTHKQNHSQYQNTLCACWRGVHAHFPFLPWGSPYQKKHNSTRGVS